MTDQKTLFPPLLWENINWSRTAASLMLVALTAWIIWMTYRRMTIREGLSHGEAWRNLREWRIAYGTMTAMFANAMLSSYAAVGRLFINTDRVSEWPVWFIWGWPSLWNALFIWGCCCSARALVPEEWGRNAYMIVIGGTVAMVVLARIFR